MNNGNTRARIGFLWLEQLWQDIKHGCRVLASSPVFTIVSVLSLAIGIGANCAIFSFADALLLRPLPVARPGEIMTVGSTASFEALNASSLVSSYPEYLDIRGASQSFEALVALQQMCPELEKGTRRIGSVAAYYRVLSGLKSVMGRIAPAISRWADQEMSTCTRYAAVVVDHRLQENFACAAHVRPSPAIPPALWRRLPAAASAPVARLPPRAARASRRD